MEDNQFDPLNPPIENGLEVSDETKAKLSCCSYCCCLGFILMLIMSFHLPTLLRGSLRTSPELNTQDYQGNYQFLQLSLIEPTTVSMKSEDNSLKVYNLT